MSDQLCMLLLRHVIFLYAYINLVAATFRLKAHYPLQKQDKSKTTKLYDTSYHSQIKSIQPEFRAG